MDSAESRPTEHNAPQGRRPWSPPAIAWEEDFLPYAFATCAKMAGQGAACRSLLSS